MPRWPSLEGKRNRRTDRSAESGKRCRAAGGAWPPDLSKHISTVPSTGKTAPPGPGMNCLPFLGHEKWEAFYACRLEGEARHRGQEGGDRALRARPRLQIGGEGAVGPARHRETMALRIPVVRKRGAAIHGRQAGQVHIRAEGRRRLRRRRRRHDEGRGDGGVRHNVDVAAQEVVRAIPPGRRGGPAPEAQGPAE